jgi:flagellar M-ring protein FliF
MPRAAIRFLGFSTADLRRIVEVLILAVVGILIILLVVRPLIAKIFETTPGQMAQTAIGPDGQPVLLTDQSRIAGALAGPGGVPMTAAGVPAASGGVPAPAGRAGGGAGSDLDTIDTMLDIAQVDGRVQASSIRKIGDIIDKHPEEAVSIIRSWIYQDQPQG